MKYDVYIYLKLEAQDEEEAERMSDLICDAYKNSQRIVEVNRGKATRYYDFDDEDIDDADFDPHEGCYSYPNCDIDPNGCCILMGDDVEPYGHRD